MAESDKDVILSIKSASKAFGTKTVINNITLDIKRGESVVILGASGSGKTVFMKMCAGLLKPSSGSIVFNNEINIASHKRKNLKEYMRKIGYLFQMNALFDSYPIWKNIMLSQVINHGLPKSIAIERAKQKLEDVSLSSEIISYYPSSISGGMQKRVALARVLTEGPDIIFFDEPTSGLDPVTSKLIGNLIRNCKKDNGSSITKISIIHDIAIAKIVADKIIVLESGLIAWSGTAEELGHVSINDIYQGGCPRSDENK